MLILTKKYFGYGIGFDARGMFQLSDGSGFNKIVIIFSSVHVGNRKKDIFILDKGPTKGLDDTSLTVKQEYAMNFSQQHKNAGLSLPYN